VLSSVTVSGILEWILKHTKSDEYIFFIVVFITGIFVFIDFVTGIIASRYEGESIQSLKWGRTIGKLLGLILYAVIGIVFLLLLPDNFLVKVVVFGIVLLTLINEYISIGENLERRLGKKFYIFTLLDKVFDLLENRFFKLIEKRILKSNE